jgi:hypothetical protein
MLNKEPYKTKLKYADADLREDISTYWNTVAGNYESQLLGVKMQERLDNRRRDRRRLRQDRVSADGWRLSRHSHSSQLMEGRSDLFDTCPLVGTAKEALFRAGLAGFKESMAPDLLSGDEEDRFVKRRRLDERRVYYHESAGFGVEYHQHLVWEYRDAFFLTREVSLLERDVVPS